MPNGQRTPRWSRLAGGVLPWIAYETPTPSRSRSVRPGWLFPLTVLAESPQDLGMETRRSWSGRALGPPLALGQERQAVVRCDGCERTFVGDVAASRALAFDHGTDDPRFAGGTSRQCVLGTTTERHRRRPHWIHVFDELLSRLRHPCEPTDEAPEAECGTKHPLAHRHEHRPLAAKKAQVPRRDRTRRRPNTSMHR